MHVRKFRVGDEAALFRVYYSAIHQVASRDYSPVQIEAWAPADLDGSRMPHVPATRAARIPCLLVEP
jgi:hypothetical protein